MSNQPLPSPSGPGPARAWRRPLTYIRPATALADRLLLEQQRASRHGVRFSVVAICHPLWNDDGKPSRERLDRHVAEHVAGIVRVSDAVYRATRPGCHVLVLPHTPESGAEIVVERVARRAVENLVHEIGPASVERIAVETTGTDTGALLQLIAEHFRQESIGSAPDEACVRPPARTPVGDAGRLEEALHTEINLAGRDGTSLTVVALVGREDGEAVPGLLACDVDEVAGQTVRGCDQVFEIGPSCVALILSRTRPEEAEVVARRLVHELTDRDPSAPYGPLSTAVLEFDTEHRDTDRFLAKLRELAAARRA